MTDELEPDETAEDSSAPLLDPMHEILTAISLVDPEALLAGFILVAEWVEPDGRPTLSVINTQMPTWHARGLIAEAGDFLSTMGQPVYSLDSMIDLDDEDDE